jgi:hypothetical protein
MAERTFIKITFLEIDPAWRRRGGEPRAEDSRGIDGLGGAASARPAPIVL